MCFQRNMLGVDWFRIEVRVEQVPCDPLVPLPLCDYSVERYLLCHPDYCAVKYFKCKKQNNVENIRASLIEPAFPKPQATTTNKYRHASDRNWFLTYTIPTDIPEEMALLMEAALTGTDGKSVKYLKKGVCMTTVAGAPTNSMAATELIPGMDKTLEKGMTPCGGYRRIKMEKASTICQPQGINKKSVQKGDIATTCSIF